LPAQMSLPGPEVSRWEKLKQAMQTSTRIFDLLSVRYRHPARGIERDFVVVRAPDWVNVIALTVDGRIVLVRQFRFGVDDFTFEIPGGVIEAGEDPIVAARRELREETGYIGSKATLLGSVRPNPAFQSNSCHIVLVDEVELSQPAEWDPDEEIQVTIEFVEDVFQMARAGRITHGLVLNALWLFEPHWRARKI
jgi:ADP-ribose pyrophosphatase